LEPAVALLKMTLSVLLNITAGAFTGFVGKVSNTKQIFKNPSLINVTHHFPY